ncbi:hypothetical protein [Fimbriiglobus ruber]|uniref:hypothetical protein n=1 Tax=Fimbriiglobus ruber TaxID=1908690 RepID=UPI00117AF34F|nr:hypothetical protein [Fimbriiglobus ruber]
METQKSPTSSATPEVHPGLHEIPGLNRIIAETRNRLGRSVEPDVVLSDLRNRGIHATREQVEQYWNEQN